MPISKFSCISYFLPLLTALFHILCIWSQIFILFLNLQVFSFLNENFTEMTVSQFENKLLIKVQPHPIY